MQKFLSAAEVQARLNPNGDIFTREELISIKVSMQFIQEKFYYEEEDKLGNTYKTLMQIKEKCINALEK